MKLDNELRILKSSFNWSTEYSEIIVLDPDGWDRTNFNYSWYEELITFNEYINRVMSSTIKVKNKNSCVGKLTEKIYHIDDEVFNQKCAKFMGYEIMNFNGDIGYSVPDLPYPYFDNELNDWINITWYSTKPSHEKSINFHKDWNLLIDKIIYKIENTNLEKYHYEWVGINNEMENNFVNVSFEIEKDTASISINLQLDPPYYLCVFGLYDNKLMNVKNAINYFIDYLTILEHEQN